uniref:Lipoprotein n=1 Tax=Geobacter sp. (strain M21) TaxID=443144 RepID=C6DZC1_GEOSM
MKLIISPIALTLCATIFISGCVSTGGTALDTHKRRMEGITQNEYVIAKQPIDRHFIGAIWSRQFGPIEEPGAPEIRIKKERSFSGVQQDFAFSAGVALGAKPVVGTVQGEIGIKSGNVDKTKLEGVEIITPVSIADIPFDPDLNYITEALRLSNFMIQNEKSNVAGVGAGAGSVAASANAMAEIGSQGRRGTEGQGLVVAYKLRRLDKSTLIKKDSGIVPLVLDETQDFPKAGVVVKAHLQSIEPGAGKSLPRNVIWACAKADAQSRNIIAAWLVDIKPLDSRRKSLTIAFPAYPKFDECQQFSSTIFARIDPLTDRIIRQNLSLVIVDADLNEQLKPAVFNGQISLSDESFKIMTVMPYEVK